MSYDAGMPKQGNPRSFRCRWCGATRRIRRGFFLCVGCDFTHDDPDEGAPFPDKET